MSKKHLTLSDLKAQGLRLTKTEATELLPHITEISHRGLDDNYVFVGPEDIDDLDDEDMEYEDDSAEDKSQLERNLSDFQSTNDEQKVIVVEYDENQDQANNSDSLSADQEAELMAAIGITTENSPEEYLTALNGFIEGITVEVPPKLLKKQAELEEIVAASQTNNTGADNAGKKEHYLTKRKRLKDAGLMEYTITQEDIVSSKYAGKAGDVIEIPIAVE